MVTDILTENEKWYKIAQICVQNRRSKALRQIQKLISSIEVSTVSTEPGNEAYFVREKNQKNPLILIIHGGPHSMAYKNMFSPVRLRLLSMGYSLWIVNYRGSLGYGLKHNEELAGHCFEMDVSTIFYNSRFRFWYYCYLHIGEWLSKPTSKMHWNLQRWNWWNKTSNLWCITWRFSHLFYYISSWLEREI